MILSLLSIVLLCIPTDWELYNDRNGDLNKSEDVIVRVLLMVGAAAGVEWLGVNGFKALNLSVAIFFFFFDYLINIILNHTVYEVKVNWFSYTGKTSGFDNLKYWRNANPWLRFGIKLAYLVVALVIFFRL